MSLIKVLLIDDDEDDYILTRDLLSPEKYELSWIDHYQEAITAVVKGLYDVYLIDYRLGKSSGIDLLNEAVKSNCSKPLIMLTGVGDQRTDEEALKLGAADYLVKNKLGAPLLERSIRYAMEHHKTLQQLKESENKFRIIFERSKDPMFITDGKGLIHEVNNAAVAFFETSRGALLTSNASSMHRQAETWDKFKGLMEEKGAVSDLDLEFITFKGRIKYCSVSSFLQISQHGNMELYFVTLHDLTHRKFQEQRHILDEKLAAIERIGKNLADEINNPLSNVNLAIDEMKSQDQQEDTLVLLDIVRKNCERINHLTEELIACTQLVNLKRQRVDLPTVVKNTVAEAERLYDADFVVQLTAYPVVLELDERNIGFAIMNILKNAVDAVYPEKARIEIVLDENAENITLTIRDMGPGIQRENLDKIVEPFFTTRLRAAGMGLTHTHRIVHAHGGKLEISSNGSDFTEVRVSLPAQR